MKGPLIIAILITFSPACAWAGDIEVVVIGITGGSSPAYGEEFDKRLRENLSMVKELFITDFPQTQWYRRKIGFDETRVVSRKLIESMKQYCTDSTVFVWGTIKSFLVKGARRSLIRGYVRGECTVSLNMYSLRRGDYSFSGDIHVDLEEPKGFILFGPAEKEITVTAIDRKDIIGRLIERGARQSAQTIATVIRSERLHAAKESESAGVNKYEAPSVSDMFTVPSVEAAAVEKKRKQAPRPPDSTASQTKTAPKAAIKPDSAARAPASDPATVQKPAAAIDTVRAKEKQ